MKVNRLIELLQLLPQNADATYLYDGFIRPDVEHVLLSRDGRVLLACDEEVVYETSDRPIGAPTSEEKPYWETGDPA